jgi:predicted DNA-binding transcriptional regulator YafY
VLTAKVRVEFELAWWVARAYPDVKTEPCPGPAGTAGDRDDAGHPATLFTTPYADADALITWVLSLGRKAELVSPPELRRLVCEKLRVLERAHA